MTEDESFDGSISQSSSSTVSPSPLFSRPPSPIDMGDFAIIPPRHPARTLVLCFDDHGDECDGSGAHNSNIIGLLSVLDKEDSRQQMVYLQSGVERYYRFQSKRINGFMGEVLAPSLATRVQDGYMYLMNNYQKGDKICFFGFGNGAHVACGLVGMLDTVGLMMTHNVSMIPWAYSLYVRDDDVGRKEAAEFKTVYSIRVRIDFVGVWGTVASVGVFQRALPFMKSKTVVRVLRQALSRDEHRARFRTVSFQHVIDQLPEARSDPQQWAPTDVVEVEFAGGHRDVGGGAVSPYTPHYLGRISLRWMIRECFNARTGMKFHADRLQGIGLNPASLYPAVAERPSALRPEPHHFDSVAAPIPLGSEEEHDVHDAVSPVYDGPAETKSLYGLIDHCLDFAHAVLSPR